MKKLLLFLLFLTGYYSSVQSQELAPGPQVLSIHSDLDDFEQPYAIYIPKNYDKKTAYPLVIMLHGAGSNHRLALRRVFGKSNAPGENDVEASRYFPEWEDVNYIVVAPYARGTAGYQGIPEQDVMQILEDVKNRFTIDENRIYLTGLSMGGGGTLWMGLTRPDIWAAIAPVCPAPPKQTKPLSGNALNFPVHFFQGDADPAVPVAGTQQWVKDMKAQQIQVEYKEYPGVRHDSWVQAYENGFIFKWFDQFQRDPNPNHIRFASHHLKYDRAYWIRLDQLKAGELAEIDAIFTSPQTLKITTTNLEAFTLNLENHPSFDVSRPLNLTIDGKPLQVASASIFNFHKSGENWIEGLISPSGTIKKKGLEGPVFDAFSKRHVYVFGTADNPTKAELSYRREQAIEAANWSRYRGEFLGRIMFFPRVISDKEVRPSDLKDANLILLGTKETNSLIADMAEDLPVHLNQEDKEHGLLYIYPQGNNYVVINSGLSWWANQPEQGSPFVSLTHRNLPDFKDFILFKYSVNTPIVEGYFDNNWKLDQSQSNTLKNSNIVTVQF